MCMIASGKLKEVNEGAQYESSYHVVCQASGTNVSPAHFY